MDDTAQNTQSQNQPVQNDSVSQTQGVQSMPSKVAIQPVGSIQKEQGPLAYQEPIQDVAKHQVAEEYLMPSESESLPKEVGEAGVEVVSKKHDIATFAKQAGIEPAKESVPVSTTPTSSIQLPMTEKEALHVIKTTNAREARHWMAVLVEKIYEQLRGVGAKQKV